MYIQEPDAVSRVIVEVIQITRKSVIILFAFISIYGIMYWNALLKRAFGATENLTGNH